MRFRHILRPVILISSLVFAACGSTEPSSPAVPTDTTSNSSTAPLTSTPTSPGTTSAPTTGGPTSPGATTTDVNPSTPSPSTSTDTTPAPQTTTPVTTTDTATSEPTTSEPTLETSADPTSSGGDESTGSDAWTPCKENPCKVLPLGDSITFGLDGGGSNGGYRVELFRLAVTNQLSITFVGSGDANGPNMVEGLPFPKAHEGFSGWTIQQIHDRLFEGSNSAAMAAEPEIVLLHIGTNDMYRGPDGAPQRLATLIDSLTERLPESLIVVSTIIPFTSAASTVSAYNTALVSVVEERISAGKHVALVDQFEGFPTSELGDGVHPNQAGYNRMGAKWFAAISQYLPPLQ